MRENQNYKILEQVEVGDIELVLGFNAKAPQPYVTWKCKDKDYYYWGHYFLNQLDARSDLYKRALEEIKKLKKEKKIKDKERV